MAGDNATFFFDTNIEDVVAKISAALRKVQADAASSGGSSTVSDNVLGDVQAATNRALDALGRLNREASQLGGKVDASKILEGYQQALNKLEREVGAISKNNNIDLKVGLELRAGAVQELQNFVKTQLAGLQNLAGTAGKAFQREIAQGNTPYSNIGGFRAGFNNPETIPVPNSNPKPANKLPPAQVVTPNSPATPAAPRPLTTAAQERARLQAEKLTANQLLAETKVAGADRVSAARQELAVTNTASAQTLAQINTASAERVLAAKNEAEAAKRTGAQTLAQIVAQGRIQVDASKQGEVRKTAELKATLDQQTAVVKGANSAAGFRAYTEELKGKNALALNAEKEASSLRLLAAKDASAQAKTAATAQARADAQSAKDAATANRQKAISEAAAARAAANTSRTEALAGVYTPAGGLRDGVTQLSSRYFKDVSDGTDRYFKRIGDGLVELTTEAEKQIAQASARQRRAIKPLSDEDPSLSGNFLQGLLSGGFDGGSGGGLNGLAKSAGTTLKYSGLYDALGLLQQGLSQATAEILNFEDSQTNLQIALENTGDAASSGAKINEDYFDSLQAIATDAGSNVGDVMDIAASGIRLVGDDATKTTAQVEELSVAFTKQAQVQAILAKTSIGDAAGNLKAISSAYDLSLDSASRVNDAIATAKNVGGGDEKQTAQALASFGAAAAQAGFSLEAAATLASRVQQATDESGAAVGNRLSKLISIVQGSAGQQAIAGVNSQLGAADQIDQNGNAYEQLLQLSKVYPQLGEAQRKSLVNTLGGTSATRELITTLNDLYPLVNNNGKGLTQAGIAAQEYQRRLHDLTVELRHLQGNAREIVTNIGQSGLLDPLFAGFKLFGTAVASVASLTEVFNGLNPVLRKTVIYLGEGYLALSLLAKVRSAGGFLAVLRGTGDEAKKSAEEVKKLTAAEEANARTRTAAAPSRFATVGGLGTPAGAAGIAASAGTLAAGAAAGAATAAYPAVGAERLALAQAAATKAGITSIASSKAVVDDSAKAAFVNGKLVTTRYATAVTAAVSQTQGLINRIAVIDAQLATVTTQLAAAAAVRPGTAAYSFFGMKDLERQQKVLQAQKAATVGTLIQTTGSPAAAASAVNGDVAIKAQNAAAVRATAAANSLYSDAAILKNTLAAETQAAGAAAAMFTDAQATMAALNASVVRTAAIKEEGLAAQQAAQQAALAAQTEGAAARQALLAGAPNAGLVVEGESAAARDLRLSQALEAQKAEQAAIAASAAARANTLVGKSGQALSTASVAAGGALRKVGGGLKQLFEPLNSPIGIAIGGLLAIGFVKGGIDKLNEALKSSTASFDDLAKINTLGAAEQADAYKDQASALATSITNIKAGQKGISGSIANFFDGGASERQLATLKTLQSYAQTQGARVGNEQENLAKGLNALTVFGDPATLTTANLSDKLTTLASAGYDATERMNLLAKALGTVGAGNSGDPNDKTGVTIDKDAQGNRVAQRLLGLDKDPAFTPKDFKLDLGAVGGGTTQANPLQSFFADNLPDIQALLAANLPDAATTKSGNLTPEQLAAAEKPVVQRIVAQYAKSFAALPKNQQDQALSPQQVEVLVETVLDRLLSGKDLTATRDPNKKLTSEEILDDINKYKQVASDALDEVAPGDYGKKVLIKRNELKAVDADIAKASPGTKLKEVYRQRDLLAADLAEEVVTDGERLRAAAQSGAKNAKDYERIGKRFLKSETLSAARGKNTDVLISILQGADKQDRAFIKKMLDDDVKRAKAVQQSAGTLAQAEAVLAGSKAEAAALAAGKSPAAAKSAGNAAYQSTYSSVYEDSGGKTADGDLRVAQGAVRTFNKANRRTATPDKSSYTDYDNSQAAQDAQDKRLKAANLAIAKRNVNALDDAGLDAAKRAVADAQTQFNAYSIKDEAYYAALKTLNNAKKALGDYEKVTSANLKEQLSIDLTNPIQTAQAAQDDAKRKLDRAKAIAKARGLKGDEYDDYIAQPTIDLRQSKAATEAAKQSEFISNLQTAEQLGDISHQTYMSYIQSEIDRTQDKLKGMKATDTGYYQTKQYLQTLRGDLKSAADEIDSQFNIGDIKLPTPYEVRRAIKAKTDGSIAQENGPFSTGGNVTTDNSQRNVVLNGVPIQQVLTIIQDLFGVKARRVAAKKVV